MSPSSFDEFEELAKQFRHQAERAGAPDSTPAPRMMPPNFWETFGGWKEEWPEVRDEIPEPVDPL